MFVVVGLYFVIEFTTNIDEYLEPMKDHSPKPTVLIVRYYLLDIPFLFLQVGPFVTLVASLFTVSKMLKHNEVVASLGAGVSAHRLLAPIVVLGLLAGACMFQLREWLSGGMIAQRDALHYVLLQGSYDQVYTN